MSTRTIHRISRRRSGVVGLTLAVLTPLVAVALSGTPAHAATPSRFSDYNGDGRADMMVFRPSDGSWSVAYSSGGTAVLRNTWGGYGDEPVPGDYNGDGRADMMVFRPRDGSWSVAYSSGGTAVLRNGWGIVGDIPVPGDYNGDGRADMMVFRPSDGSWSVAYSSGGSAVLRNGWGIMGDIPVSGDYNGDGRADMMVFRPRDGSWSVAYSSGGSAVLRNGWGIVGDIPVSGDYNGDGRADMMVFRPRDGSWSVAYSSGGTAVPRTSWGGYDDQPMSGDYDGDGRDDMMIFRPRDGSWSVAYSSGASAVLRNGWGIPGDLGLPGGTRPGTPSRSDGANKPVLFVHGWESTFNSGANCDGDYWYNALNTFRSWWSTANLKTVGYYSDDTNCDLSTGSSATRSTPIETIGRDFAWLIYNNYSRYGRSVDLVAHSMGGLVSRVAITGTQTNTPGFPPYLFVEDAVTLSTPHNGRGDSTGPAACDPFSDECDQMRVNSAFMKAWINPFGNPQASGLGTDWTAVASGDDLIVSSSSGLDLPSSYQFGHKVLYYSGQGLGHTPMHQVYYGGFHAGYCNWNTTGCNVADPNTYVQSTLWDSPVTEAVRAVSYQSIW